MNRSDVEFQSNGTLCRAWHYHPASDDFTGPNGAPCVVMAHGFGGIRPRRGAGFPPRSGGMRPPAGGQCRRHKGTWGKQ